MFVIRLLASKGALVVVDDVVVVVDVVVVDVEVEVVVVVVGDVEMFGVVSVRKESKGFVLRMGCWGGLVEYVVNVRMARNIVAMDTQAKMTRFRDRTLDLRVCEGLWGACRARYRNIGGMTVW